MLKSSISIQFTILFLAFLFCNTALLAQGQYKFNEQSHDFGSVTEGNIASHEFEFTNVGNQPIIISNVKASCGCTTPFWTKEPVLPGQIGKIKASYNSKGRPGAFNKTITITSNASEPSKMLTIKGSVQRVEAEPSYTAEELAASPKIEVDQMDFNLGKVEMGQSVIRKFNITNKGKSGLMFKDLQSTCNCVTVLSAPEVVEVGQTAALELKITPRLVSKRKESITLLTNDITKGKTILTYDSEVVKDLAAGSIMQSPDNSNPFK
jgi:hypothetical protein